jgi:hypothetical protein
MKVWKVRQYLPALLWYVQRRVEGGRGFLVAIRIGDVCGVDRRCCTEDYEAAGGERASQKTQTRRLPNREERRRGGPCGFEAVDMTTAAAKKIKTTAAVFELPQKLGILQYVEYEPPPREWCAGECLYEGLLTAEGCRRGVCVRYRVWVHSRDRRTWEVKERWRRRSEDAGGCIKQQVADALWELAEKYDVGVWYERVRVGAGVNQYDVFCGVVVNGVKLYQPHCRSVDDCVKQIIEDYKREVEKMREPPKPALVINYDPAEELLKEWPELEAFGTEWVKAWAPHSRDRLTEIAKTLRRFPWMVEVVKKKPVSNPHPYMVEVYVARDESEVCLTLNQLKTFCARDGAVKEVKLELEFSRYEIYEDKIREVYRPKGLLAFTTTAREYIRLL